MIIDLSQPKICDNIYMNEEFYTELVVTSRTLTPEHLNSVLGMRFDKGYHTGDVRGRSTIKSKENSWIIYSRISRNLPLENHIKDLLEGVSPISEKIRTVADQSDFEVIFGCIIYTRDRPALFFTKEQVATIYRMGAGIDIDLYFLPKRRNK